MVSDFIDWMIDGLYEFKWLVEDMVNWEVNSLKTIVQEIVRRIKKKMRICIGISKAAFTHFSNEAAERGVPVKTLISGEVEALYCIALEEKWREEDFEEATRCDRERDEEDENDD